MKKNVETKDVQDWWDSNPFTLGVAEGEYKDNDLVGRVDFDKMNLDYFNKIDTRFRKHTRFGGQKDDAPLLSNLIDYDWLKGKRMLDIAVGSGFSAVSFADHGAQVVGIDLTDFAVEQTKRNFKCRNLEAEILQMDAQNMTFPDNDFDFVHAWGCLMHMPDTDKAIREIYRITKPGGRTMAYMYNRDSWPFWFNYMFVKGILFGALFKYKGDIDRITSRYSDGYTKGGNQLTKFFRKKTLHKKFTEAGFKNVEVFPFDLIESVDVWPVRPFPVFRYLPKPIRSWISRNLAYGVIIKAEK